MQWLDEDFADACDFELLGLSSHLPPHRLAWELNQRLEWRLEFFKVLEIQQRQGHSEHAVYRYEDASSHKEYVCHCIILMVMHFESGKSSWLSCSPAMHLFIWQRRSLF